MEKKGFTLTKSRFDLILDKDKLNKKSRIRKRLSGIGIAIELFILAIMLKYIVPIMLINILVFGIGCISLGLYGFICHMINKCISSNYIKLLREAINSVDIDEKKLREMIQGYVVANGITIDKKSFKLYRVHSYIAAPDPNLKDESTYKSNKRIMEFNKHTDSELKELNEYISVTDKKNKVIGFIRIVINYEEGRVKSLNNDTEVNKIIPYSYWYGPEELDEVPNEIRNRANMLYRLDQEKSKPKTRIRRPEPFQAIYR